MAQTNNYIITEQDIINTYDGRQQEQCRLYYKYKDIKQQNPSFGYKRIAKILGHKYGKTRWWHSGKHIPTPIQTVNWLKEKELIPLTIDNPKLQLIAKIIGATFGDGGIDINHNMLFLSSSEQKALEDFKQDIIKIFGIEIEKNFDIRVGGVNKTSFCIRNTNRKIIRLFKALGTPIGNKTKQEIFVPGWVKRSKEFKHAFYSSFFGSEMGIPLCRGGQANTFDVAIGGLPEYHNNRINFMNGIRLYLDNIGIKTGKISINKSKPGKNQKTFIYRLLLSTNIENMIRFYERIKLSYCYYKIDKLRNTINDIIKIKSERVKELKTIHGWGEEKILMRLNINPTNKSILETTY